jgi:hypothetical protein
MLWLFGKVSNQDRIREVRDRIRGNLIAIRLFGDDLGQLFRLQGRVFGHTFVYLWRALPAFVILLIPVALIATQLHLRFQVRPLRPQETALVKVELRDAEALRRELALEVPEGITVETPPVRAEVIREVSWRVRADEPGDYRIAVRVGDERVEKEARVGAGWGVTSWRKTGKGAFDLLLWSGEPPIDRASRIARIDLTYPSLDVTVFGWAVHWVIIFLVVSIAAGFAFRRVLGVEI